ncbi:MAG: hypothetical protein M9953_05015 [Thermomicrobiales bacterium]|nr:hypothetical protein [Thermomicrobiales bacterium]MCO5224677.1 hypothetical protein [Thermomicrobiales bacterium]MCO5226666.1 hypothetical protein [Thermomicrobiales bacterium]
MDIRRTASSFWTVAILLTMGFSGAVAAPVDPTSSDTSNGKVTILSGGTFNAEFCGQTSPSGDGQDFVFDSKDIEFSDATVSLSQGYTSEGVMVICYTDTALERGAFTTSMSASNFTNDDGAVISSTNLHPVGLVGPIQGRTSTAVPTVGDIHAWDGVSISTTHPGDFVVWQGGDLSISQQVGYGLEGDGTAAVLGGLFLPGAFAPIFLELDIPAGTPGGTYTTEFTLTVAPVGP